ncbi:hypothetical protein DYQ86_02460 [Acidobacteria bacterium AB60]|nr:hypothetical protein DYQ86_02460 [Acidobacteria bacterium AB60]
MAVAQGQPESTPYPGMAPLDQYLIADKNAEIALARSAAPPSISDAAEVMVLERTGYTTALPGRNGFICMVERSWGASTTDRDFWNPKTRSPVCFNAAAARTYVPRYLMKTRLVLAGRPKAEFVRAVQSAVEKKELPPLELGAMAYMMSREQYLSDEGIHWHPHLMFFVPGDAGKQWGADLAGSPVMAANDSEEAATIFLVWVGNWSDGTAGPPVTR